MFKTSDIIKKFDLKNKFEINLKAKYGYVNEAVKSFSNIPKVSLKCLDNKYDNLF